MNKIIGFLLCAAGGIWMACGIKVGLGPGNTDFGLGIIHTMVGLLYLKQKG